jgi:hypothetical protein
MAPARTPRLMLAACALLAAVACGVPAQAGDAAAAFQAAPPPQGASTPSSELKFGTAHVFAGGVSITVSAPRAFQPSASAYPAAERAAAFDIAVTNSGSDPYRLSGFSAVVTVAGTQATQVVDSTQGFNGIIDAGKDVAPGKTVRLSLAFAMPPQPCELRLVIRPSTESAAAITYSGSA